MPAFATLLVISFSLAQPQPTDGPAIPVDFLKSEKLFQVRIEQNWAFGCYGVTFIYHVQPTVPQVAALFPRERNLQTDGRPPNESYYVGWRDMDGIHQQIAVARSHYVGSGTKDGKSYTIDEWDKFTTVMVTEEPSRIPPRWYKGAISPKPPVPLIEVPFLPGVRCEYVSLTSLEGLLSGSGAMFKGSDAAIYRVLLKRPLKGVQKSQADWAIANGYKQQQFGSFFKPNVKIFEVESRSYRVGKEEYTEVTLYTTDKKASTPVARAKI